VELHAVIQLLLRVAAVATGRRTVEEEEEALIQL
jgi:hypothetical protein